MESLSGAIMIWRFRPHPGLTPELEARKEKRAITLVGYTFFVLAAYVIIESLRKLYFREIPEPQSFGAHHRQRLHHPDAHPLLFQTPHQPSLEQPQPAGRRPPDPGLFFL